MNDDELAQLRAKRMQELQNAQGDGCNKISPEEMAKRRNEQDIAKNSILIQVRIEILFRIIILGT